MKTIPLTGRIVPKFAPTSEGGMAAAIQNELGLAFLLARRGYGTTPPNPFLHRLQFNPAEAAVNHAGCGAAARIGSHESGGQVDCQRYGP